MCWYGMDDIYVTHIHYNVLVWNGYGIYVTRIHYNVLVWNGWYICHTYTL